MCVFKCVCLFVCACLFVCVCMRVCMNTWCVGACVCQWACACTHRCVLRVSTRVCCVYVVVYVCVLLVGACACYVSDRRMEPEKTWPGLNSLDKNPTGHAKPEQTRSNQNSSDISRPGFLSLSLLVANSISSAFECG